MKNEQINTTVIGAFVLGSIVLILAGIMIFGSGRLFKVTDEYVLHFRGSVKGLTVGAPVSFRGVRIGQVKAIRLLVNSESIDLSIPVVIEIDPTRLQLCCDEQGRLINWEEGNPDRTIDDFIAKGLRGKLEIQSLVTGQLMVDLDFYPDTPPQLSGIHPMYQEIPTIQAPLQEFIEEIGQIPFGKIAQKALRVLESLDVLLRTPELRGSLVTMQQVLLDAQGLIVSLDEQIETITTNLNATLVDTRSLVNNLDGEVKPISDEARQTALAVRETLARAQLVLDNLRQLTGAESDLRVEALRALQEVSEAMRSLRVLTQFLETHPESLLRGKRQPGGEE